ncbi:MAG: Stp1/IreP family PP2C-type Ser/Thr phosphatase [Coriobacteriales bacterium]|jgi:protein phosphatase|nr:Stp1/IreP family PP2C-type Ser/Thr phosphatase [Coriobacteriales bacterium]
MRDEARGGGKARVAPAGAGKGAARFKTSVSTWGNTYGSAYENLLVGSRTDVGLVREHNEDSLLVSPPLFVIADGMGGHAAGEVASELAVHIFEEFSITGADPEALRHATIKSNSAIIRGAQEGLGRKGMGTTLTAAVIEEDRLLIAQVGDSRAYLLQNGQLRQVTRDHSLVEELIAAGQLTRAEARTHPNRSVITRALGSDPNVLPDIYEMSVQSGDRLMLCSDGLSGMLDSDDLQELLSLHSDPQETADALVDAANEAGGHDNITVIVVDIGEVKSRAMTKTRQRFIWGVAVFFLVFALLAIGTVGAVYAYARNAVYLIDEGGYVALYRGLPGEVLGIELTWHVETTTIPVSALNPASASRLEEGLRTESMHEAQALIHEWRERLADGR